MSENIPLDQKPSSYMDFLPAVYRQGEVDGKANFLGHFLKLSEKILSGIDDNSKAQEREIVGIEQILDKIHDYFDPLFTPPIARGSSPLNRGEVRLERIWGSQPSSSWECSQQRPENGHRHHHLILPQSRVPCQRPNWPGEHSDPLPKDQRFLCTQCRKTFAATKGTAFYRLRTPAETVALVLTLLAHGCPLQAIVVAFAFDGRTVAAWWARSGRQGKPSKSHLVEQPRDLGHVQAG